MPSEVHYLKSPNPPSTEATDELRSRVSEILRRHEAWRTGFTMVDEEPVQVVHPPLSLDLPFADLRALSQEKREAEALRLAAEDLARPFGLAPAALLGSRFSEVGHVDGSKV